MKDAHFFFHNHQLHQEKSHQEEVKRKRGEMSDFSEA